MSALAIVDEEKPHENTGVGEGIEWTTVTRHRRGHSRQWEGDPKPMRSPRRASFMRSANRC
ncbi:hypothetical protein EXIGLDRAFT_725531 [Exidia glandulosa HHB12029]|uniref:Uncharacterized protein n=1 Tax=Exidia glandulosa HHB12029 TaxID=1314781 RepID=A0A165E060_EXIGL|nr:hypothetical protein EXIGLDRAFT_725531 [Exidia glandulosa HHB12029]